MKVCVCKEIGFAELKVPHFERSEAKRENSHL